MKRFPSLGAFFTHGFNRELECMYLGYKDFKRKGYVIFDMWSEYVKPTQESNLWLGDMTIDENGYARIGWLIFSLLHTLPKQPTVSTMS